MTKEEAIRILKNFSLCGVYHQLIHMNDTDSEAISMAIKALEQPEPCEDAISRQAVFDEAFEVDTKEYGRIDVVGVDAIVALPPVTPQPKTGHLREQARWIPCSERLPEVHESGNSFSGIYMQSVPALVYGICEGEENAQFHVATYCDDLDGTTYWSTELDALTVTCVKAWMPLPEPYREEGTE